MKLTPKNTVDAIRLLAKHDLYEPDDPEEVRDQLQSMAVVYLAQKRDGETDLEFVDWYENADISKMNDLLEEAAGEPDPTPSSDAS